jgi:hypothetical protein
MSLDVADPYRELAVPPVMHPNKSRAHNAGRFEIDFNRSVNTPGRDSGLASVPIGSIGKVRGKV